MPVEPSAPIRSVAPQLYDAWTEAWGTPLEAVSVQHGPSGHQLNVLLFARPDERVVRLVTHGLARTPDAEGRELQLELLLLADRDLGGAELRPALEFVVDVAAHLLAFGVRPLEPTLMPPSDLSPFGPRALLFDEPLGEPQHLAALEADGTHVHLVQLIPIHAEEYAYIDAAESAADAIELLARSMDLTWADLGRPPSPATWLKPS